MYHVYAELTHKYYDPCKLYSDKVFNNKDEAEAWIGSNEGNDFAQHAMICIDTSEYLSGYVLEGLKVHNEIEVVVV